MNACATARRCRRAGSPLLPSTCAHALAVILFACGAPPAPPLTPDDFTLLGVPPGSDSTEIRLTFGEPDSVSQSRNPFGGAVPLSTWIYDGFEVRFGERATPVGYMIHERGERTARGIGVGDAAALVLQAYGEPSAKHQSGWTYIAAGDESGPGVNAIDVVVQRDTVRRIYIGWATD